MSRKWIALSSVAAACSAIAIGAVATGSVLGSGSNPRPDYATVTIDLSDSKPEPANARAGIGGSKKKPKLVYLQSSAPTTINPADVGAGGLGPYVDVKLTGCSKVVSGGVLPASTDVFVQGSYVKSPSEYHVLIALDDGALAARTPFTITSNLTCLKGVK